MVLLLYIIKIFEGGETIGKFGKFCLFYWRIANYVFIMIDVVAVLDFSIRPMKIGIGQINMGKPIQKEVKSHPAATREKADECWFRWCGYIDSHTKLFV